MPKQINTYTFGQALVQKFGLKGRFQPVLDETIVPVTLVDSDLAVRLAVGGTSAAAAGAGNQHVFSFRNPPNSGKLVTLTSWFAASGTPLTDFMNISIGKSTTPSGSFMTWRDNRLAGVPVARITAITSPTVALVSPHYHLDNDDKQWIGRWHIDPGGLLQFRNSVANTTLDLSMQWEESDLTASLGA